MKIFMFFINAIFWSWCFIVPAGLLAFLAWYLYLKNSNLLAVSIVLGVIGVACGFFFAEFVRKRYGLDNFFGRRLATPDIDGGNILDKKDNVRDESGNKDHQAL
jgi:hypothetical protein